MLDLILSLIGVVVLVGYFSIQQLVRSVWHKERFIGRIPGVRVHQTNQEIRYLISYKIGATVFLVGMLLLWGGWISIIIEGGGFPEFSRRIANRSYTFIFWGLLTFPPIHIVIWVWGIYYFEELRISTLNREIILVEKRIKFRPAFSRHLTKRTIGFDEIRHIEKVELVYETQKEREVDYDTYIRLIDNTLVSLGKWGSFREDESIIIQQIAAHTDKKLVATQKTVDHLLVEKANEREN